MSAYPRPLQPQDQHYQYQDFQDFHQSNHPAQDPDYAHVAGAPFQQQSGYHQQQQYSHANPYANHTQSAFHTYSQNAQYNDHPYHGPSRSYAAHNGLSYQHAAPAHSQGGYLPASDYAHTGHFSPHQHMQGSLSSGQSPGSSTGRSRFVHPSQRTSPSLESQVAHLGLGAPVASLPSKPLSTSRQSARFAPSQYHHDISTANVLTFGEAQSDISLRYPPLPSVPERCATPPQLKKEAHMTSKTDENLADQSVLEYVSSLRSIIQIYEKRDDQLRMRTEAVGFQPKQAWAAWQRPSSSTDASNDTSDSRSNPILGVRLLQQLNKLQRENDELGQLLASGSHLNTNPAAAAEADELRKEVQECHKLIDAMDKALKQVEDRAKASERALEAACKTQSTAILPAASMRDGGGAQGSRVAGSAADGGSLKHAASSRKGSKSTNQNSGGGGKSQSKTNQSPAKGVGGSGAGKPLRSDKMTPSSVDKTGKPSLSSAPKSR